MPHKESTNSPRFELQDHVDQFENYLSVTQTARLLAARDRDYVDHKQWSSAEAQTLEARGQAPVVINKTKAKVNTLTGIQRQQRRDPKALPRTPKHEDAADSATDAIRFVADNEDFQVKSTNVFEREVVWGYGAVIVEVEERGDQIEIAINEIHSDRYYYDPFSRQKNFGDKKFDGIVIWADEDDAIELFPGKKDEIQNAINTVTDLVDGDTFEDQPTWVDRERRRIRICQHYFKHGGKWYLTYFTGTDYLAEPVLSPYLDEHGEPSDPIEAQTAYIDRENDRYGEVRAYIWSQDEINHRRSKLLYQLSVRQTKGEKGAVDDVDVMKRELAKPDGHVEVNPNFDLEILPTQDQVQGQFLLYQESKNEIDAVGANAALSGEVPDGLSGRAIQSLQQGGIAELGGLFDGHSHWEKRVYRQIWNRIKQFWDAERWIRVTDDEDALRWVGLNQPMTKGQVLQEQAQQGNQQAQALLQASINDPRLNEIAEVRNNVAELDVDILLEQTTDFATLRHEQFDILARLAQAYGPQEVPFETMLELSEFPHKKDFKEEQQVDPEQQQAQTELQGAFVEQDLRKVTLDNDETESDIALNEANIRQKEVETLQLASAPASTVNVSV